MDPDLPRFGGFESHRGKNQGCSQALGGADGNPLRCGGRCAPLAAASRNLRRNPPLLSR